MIDPENVRVHLWLAPKGTKASNGADVTGSWLVTVDHLANGEHKAVCLVWDVAMSGGKVATDIAWAFAKDEGRSREPERIAAYERAIEPKLTAALEGLAA